MDVPMVDQDEFALIHEARLSGMAVVERERIRRGATVVDQIPLGGEVAEQLRPMLEMYHLLTGFVETNPNALWHHRISDHGPPCPSCRKPLRTELARFCAACGYGIEESQHDPRPLVERRAGEFES
jgi:hypothetical protein